MAKIVFFGTPSYVVPILDQLSREHKIVAVVTQPPKAMGRAIFKKEALKEYSPVDDWAHKRKVTRYFEPVKIVEEAVEADMGVLESYGEFIPKNVISYFEYGIINAHPSLLPKWRGSSPAQATILSGEKETGVSIIKLDNEWDHGPIISGFKEEVKEDDTAGTLRDRLFERSGQFLLDLIPNYLNEKVLPKEQDHENATFTTQIKKDDGFISEAHLKLVLAGKESEEEMKINWIKNFSLKVTPINIERFIRAMQPWPGAWTLLRLSATEGQATRMKILKAHLENLTTSTQHLVPDLVQLEGKNKVTWEQFKAGYQENSLAL